MSRPDDPLAALTELGLRSAALLHELRQPLFVLKGLVDLAIGRGTGLGDDDLRLVRDELRHVEALVEHYGLSQPSGEPAEWVDLARAVEAAASTLEPRARRVGVTLRVVSVDRVSVSARPTAVRQVVVNLVANAIDAAASGGRTVEVAARRGLDGAPEVEVLDDGPGIDPRVRGRLAEPFVTTKPAGAGTGLGLFVARRLAEEWGGALRVETRDGAPGTRAAVTFRIAADDQR